LVKGRKRAEKIHVGDERRRWGCPSLAVHLMRKKRKGGISRSETLHIGDHGGEKVFREHNGKRGGGANILDSKGYLVSRSINRSSRKTHIQACSRQDQGKGEKQRQIHVEGVVERCTKGGKASGRGTVRPKKQKGGGARRKEVANP